MKCQSLFSGKNVINLPSAESGKCTQSEALFLFNRFHKK